MTERSGDAIHTITIAGREALLTGAPGDEFWRGQKGFDSHLLPLGRYVEKHVSEDAIVLDVGANIGLMTMVLARRCSRGHVYAIEPVPGNVCYLRRNLELNRIRNCTVIEAAVSNASGTTRIHSQGAYSNVLSASRSSANEVEVRTLTLDDLAGSSFAGKRVAFAKIDVEGFEPNVLDGGRALIERDRPWVFVEFNSWCLWSMHAYDQCAFAHALWDAFSVSSIDKSGEAVASFGNNPIQFLQHNATSGFVDDLLLQLAEGHRVPSFEEMTSCLPAWQMRRDLAAMRRSMSWRVTAPLRRLGRAVRAILGRP